MYSHLPVSYQLKGKNYIRLKGTDTYVLDIDSDEEKSCEALPKTAEQLFAETSSVPASAETSSASAKSASKTSSLSAEPAEPSPSKRPSPEEKKLDSELLFKLEMKCENIYNQSKEYACLCKKIGIEKIPMKVIVQKIRDLNYLKSQLIDDSNAFKQFNDKAFSELCKTLANYELNKENDFATLLNFFKKIVTEKISTLRDLNLLRVLQSFIKLDISWEDLNEHSQSELFKPIKKELMDPHLDIEKLINLLWCCAVMAVPLDQLISKEEKNALTARLSSADFENRRIFTLKRLNQLSQAVGRFSWNLDNPPDYIRIVEKIHRYVAIDYWASDKPRSSTFHFNVSETIAEITQEKFDMEKLIIDRPVDMCFKNYKVIIEANGPCHYTKEGKLNLISRFHDTLNLMRGYKTIHVSLKEWQSLKSRDTAKEALDKKILLAKKLNEAGIPVQEKYLWMLMAPAPSPNPSPLPPSPSPSPRTLRVVEPSLSPSPTSTPRTLRAVEPSPSPSPTSSPRTLRAVEPSPSPSPTSTPRTLQAAEPLSSSLPAPKPEPAPAPAPLLNPVPVSTPTSSPKPNHKRKAEVKTDSSSSASTLSATLSSDNSPRAAIPVIKPTFFAENLRSSKKPRIVAVRPRTAADPPYRLSFP